MVPPDAGLLGRFLVRCGASRERWPTFAVELLSIPACAVTHSTLVLWLFSDLGYCNQETPGLVTRAVMDSTTTSWLVLAAGMVPLAIDGVLILVLAPLVRELTQRS